MRLIDARAVLCVAFGLGIAMSLSSLILWRSGWLSSPLLSVFGAHGTSVLVGIAICAAVLGWSFCDARGAGLFCVRACPLLMLASLALSALLGFAGFDSAQMIIGYALPVAGSYGLIFGWFYLIGLLGIETGLMGVLAAWAVSVPVRAAAELVGSGELRLVVSIALVCVAGVLLRVQSRACSDAEEPARESPREYRRSTLHALRSLWKSAVFCGALAFLGGVIRSLSLQEEAMAYINAASVAGGLLAALALAWIWRSATIRYRISSLFRGMFPVLVVLLCALPFFGTGPFVLFAAALYMVYSFVSLSMQVLCVQTARDYGASLLSCMSFQIGVTLSMQGAGYFTGGLTHAAALSSVPHLAVVSLFSVAMLALVLFATRGLSVTKEEEGRSIEFLSLSREGQPPIAREAGLQGAVEGDGADEEEGGAEEGLSDASALERRSAIGGMRGGGGPRGAYAEELAVRCASLRERYYLSQREEEVLSLVAQGYTMTSIAEELFISENTVKTHMRRLYGKLGIHKKQELFALVNDREG